MAYPVPMWAGVNKEAAPSGPPTAVSIATSPSGNYNNATDGIDTTGCSFTAMNYGGSGWLFNSLIVNVPENDFSVFNGCSSVGNVEVYGYLRATGATSYLWDLSIVSQSLSNGCLGTIAGTASTSHDSTGAGGIGESLQIIWGGGRGGFLFPLAGDQIILDIEGDATNGSGTTSAIKCRLTYDIVP